MPPVSRTQAPRSTYVQEPGAALTSATKSLRLRIQQDQLVRKAVMACIRIQLNPKLTAELLRYFITARDLARPGFYDYKVNTKFQNPRVDIISVIEASLRIQAYRDRVCELQLELINIKNILQRGYKAASNVIYELYGQEMAAAGLRAEATQKQFVTAVLSPINDRIINSDNQIKQIEATLENLDKAHYAYKAVGDLAEKVLSRSEGGFNAARAPMPTTREV